ncbi:Ig-like domain-containing protein [Aureibacter tunicatorum]|uniref:Gliding motility-associated-like protein n=1 Tax=Aureibacter tunicatorum TaxID=866807 RepID=A0AAE4BST4_9BACT|nr:Ig-like domain-containing protein [Aureibacter tunicatorum]MDR6239158.1 gliding motility-associated-like protein [Aureibacter tunicatorum]BDD04916.1 hypothetical protein AUTU_23990 [Aureibacter tunicatorum]
MKPSLRTFCPFLQAGKSILNALILTFAFISASSLEILAQVPVPDAPDLIEQSDKGRLNDDNITNDTAPFFQGTVMPNATVSIYSDQAGLLATDKANALGYYIIQVPNEPSRLLQDGEHKITATQNVAGDVSERSEALLVTIDTVIPDQPATTDLDIFSDFGFSREDEITNDSLPTFVGTTEPKSIVTVFYGDQISLGSDLADPVTGEYAVEIKVQLPEGHHDITITVTDEAGNTSAESESLGVEIDRTPPVKASLPSIDKIEDTGNHEGLHPERELDYITYDNELTFLGSKEQDTRIAIVTRDEWELLQLFLDIYTDYVRVTDTLNEIIILAYGSDAAEIIKNIPKDKNESVGYYIKIFSPFDVISNFEEGEEDRQVVDYSKVSRTLVESKYELLAISWDRAGNYSVSEVRNLEVDMTAPATKIDMVDESDSYYTNYFIEYFLNQPEDRQKQLTENEFTIEYASTRIFTSDDFHDWNIYQSEIVTIPTEYADEFRDYYRVDGSHRRIITEHVDNYTQIVDPEFMILNERGQCIYFKLFDSNGTLLDEFEMHDLQTLIQDYKFAQPLEDGTYRMEYTNIDIAGNESNHFVEFFIDTESPVVSKASIIDLDDTGRTIDDELTEKTIFSLEGTAENRSNIELWYILGSKTPMPGLDLNKVDTIVGLDTTSYVGNYLIDLSDSIPHLPDGEHTFLTKAYDSANNVSLAKFNAVVRTVPQVPDVTQNLVTDEEKPIDVVITRDYENVPAVSYFKITDIKNGTVTFINEDGETVDVKNHDYLKIPAGDESIIVTYLPNKDLFSYDKDEDDKFSFNVQASKAPKNEDESGLKMDLIANPEPEVTAKVPVKIHVLPVNDHPLFNVNHITIYEDQNWEASASWVSGIDDGPVTDDEGQTYKFDILEIEDPTYFTEDNQPHFTDDVQGVLDFSLAENKFGQTSLTIRLKDDGGIERNGVDTLVRELIINVTPVPDNPRITQSGEVVKDNELWMLEDGVEVLADQNGEDSLAYNPIMFSIEKNELDGDEIIGFYIESMIESRGKMFYIDGRGNRRFIYNYDFVNINDALVVGYIPELHFNDDQPEFNNKLEQSEIDIVPYFDIIAVMDEVPDEYQQSKERGNARIVIEPINDEPEFVVSDWNIDVESEAEAKYFDKDRVVNKLTPGGGVDELGQNFDFKITNLEELRATGVFTDDGLPKLVLDQYKEKGNLQFTIVPNAEGRVEVKVVMYDDGIKDLVRGDDNDTDEESIFIEIKRTDYYAATDIELDPNHIKKESPSGTEVGTITFNDVDLPDDSHIIEKVDGEGSEHNDYFDINNWVVSTSQDLPDFGELEELSIRVKITDSYDKVAEKILVIRLTDKDVIKSSIPVLTSDYESINEDQTFAELKGEGKILKFGIGELETDAEITHFFISDLTNGTLHHLADGTLIDIDFPITVDQAVNDGIIFVPDADYFGPASFKIQAAKDNNELAISDPLDVNLTVNPINDKPFFEIDIREDLVKENEIYKYYISQDTKVHSLVDVIKNISVGPANESEQVYTFNITHDQANDLYFESLPVVSPLQGLITDATLGTLDFELSNNAIGNITLTITLEDDGEPVESHVETLILVIGDKPDVPVIPTDPTIPDGEYAKVIWEDQELILSEIISKNAGDSETVKYVKFSDFSNLNGKITLGDNIVSVDELIEFDKLSEVKFVPNKDYFGDASFTVKSSDGQEESASAVVNIKIEPVNDQPIFDPLTVTIELEEDQLDEENYVLRNIFETISVGPENESDQIFTSIEEFTYDESYFSIDPVLTINDLNLNFSLAEDVNGQTSITFKIKDNGGVDRNGVDLSETITIVLDIASKADKPDITDPEVTDPTDPTDTRLYHFVTLEDTPFEFVEELVGRNDVDGGGDLYIKISNILNGSIKSGDQTITTEGYVHIDDINQITFVPAQDYFGQVSFDLQATTAIEGGNLSESVQVLGKVLPVNDKPSFEVDNVTIFSSTNIYEYKSSVVDALNTGGITSLEDYQSVSITYSVEFVNESDKDLFFDGNEPSIDNEGNLSFILKADPPQGIIELIAVANDHEEEENLSDPVKFNIIINEGEPPVTEKPVVGTNPVDGGNVWWTYEDTTLEGIVVKTSETDKVTQVFYVSTVKHGTLYFTNEDGELEQIEKGFITKGQAFLGLTFVPDPDYFNITDIDPAGFVINGALAEDINLIGDGAFIQIPVYPINDQPEFNAIDTLIVDQSAEIIELKEVILSNIYNGAYNEYYQYDTTLIAITNSDELKDNPIFGPDPYILKDYLDSTGVLHVEVPATLYGDAWIHYVVVEHLELENRLREDSLYFQVKREDNIAPDSIVLDPYQVMEQRPEGTFVGLLYTYDKNIVDSHVYQMVDGEGDEGNDYFEIRGDSVFTMTEFYYDQGDLYTIRVRSTDERGAWVEEVLEIEILPDYGLDLVIPNAFTPNGDFVNDTWEIDNIRIHESVTVEIFNSRGTQVYYSNGYDKPWDGRFNGSVLPKASYYFVIKLNDENGRVFKGTVSILK